MYITEISLKKSSYLFLDINRCGFNTLFFDDFNVTD